MKPRIRAGAFLRASTKDAAQSIEAQRSAIYKEAASQGVEVCDEFVYASEGNGRGAEVGRARLEADACAGKFGAAGVSVIFAWSIDRLGRKSAEVLKLIRVLAAHGVKLRTVR